MKRANKVRRRQIFISPLSVITKQSNWGEFNSDFIPLHPYNRHFNSEIVSNPSPFPPTLKLSIQWNSLSRLILMWITFHSNNSEGIFLSKSIVLNFWWLVSFFNVAKKRGNVLKFGGWSTGRWLECLRLDRLCVLSVGLRQREIWTCTSSNGINFVINCSS